MGAVALPARNTEVHGSELKVLSDDGKVRGADEQDKTTTTRTIAVGARLTPGSAVEVSDTAPNRPEARRQRAVSDTSSVCQPRTEPVSDTRGV